LPVLEYSPMSLHYELTLSLRLRPDVPEAFLEELRYHLGLSPLAPQAPTLDWDGPALSYGSDEGELAGGPVASMIRQQPYLNRPAVWGVFARTFVLDDVMWELVQVVLPWLAGWSLTEGWIGFAREELGLTPWLDLFASQGHAYVAPPGEGPSPLGEQAPPFALTQTTEGWPLAR
jgi:hypothetical protein